MTRSVEALVEPPLLKWARESAHMSEAQAASRLKVEVAKIQAWESGAEKLTLAKLREVANVYKRPLAVFYLPEPPRDFSAMRDFRRIDGVDEPLSPDLAFQLRRAQQRRAVALELADMLGDNPPSFTARTSIEAGVEEAARLAREALGVRADEHLAIRDPGKAFNWWKGRAETAGILVFETERIAVEEMRGFSIAANVFPVIGVNGADASAGRIFSLAHELGHLLLNEGGICEFFERTSAESQRIEVFCNGVAAELTMPRTVFLVDHTVRSTGREAWTHRLVSEVATRFSVSREAVLVRLQTLNRIGVSVARAIMGEIRASYVMAKPDRGESKGGPKRHILILKYNGRAFTQLVLRAYHRERITPVDVSDYLAAKVKHLPELEASAWGT